MGERERKDMCGTFIKISKIQRATRFCLRFWFLLKLRAFSIDERDSFLFPNDGTFLFLLCTFPFFPIIHVHLELQFLAVLNAI